MDSKKDKFSIASRLRSFKAACEGLIIVIKNEHNIWVHLLLAALAISLGIILGISFTEWLILVLCIGLVLSLECINTAIEILVNFVSPEKNQKAKEIKDISAGAVLIAALTALIAGAIIFLPKIIIFF